MKLWLTTFCIGSRFLHRITVVAFASIFVCHASSADAQDRNPVSNATSASGGVERQDRSADLLQDRELLARLAQGPMRRFTFLKTARLLPDISAVDQAGSMHQLSDWQGQVILLNVWASWCAPCRDEMPSLAELERRIADSGVRVVTLSIDKTRKDAVEFLQSVNAQNLPLLLDLDRSVIKKLDVDGAPTSLLIDRQGRELGRVTGPIDWTADEAVLLLKAIALKSRD